MTYDLVVLDMAGTTVKDDGLVERSFEVAFDEVGLATSVEEREVALEHVRATMGQSKIDVFTAMAGDAELGARMTDIFERAYAGFVAAGEIEEMPGARAAIGALQADGIAVAFTTGFAPATQQAILTALGWDDLAELALAPVDAGGRGRPYPDLNLTAIIRLRTSSVAAMVVVGDTTSDIRSGVSAGAGRVVGVLTGAHSEEELRAAGATDVVASVAGLVGLLGG